MELEALVMALEAVVVLDKDLLVLVREKDLLG